jgi:uncharacterized protein (TIGR02594 family)
MTDTPWMDKAKAYIGLTEVPGPKSNPVIEKFYKNVAKTTAKDDVPWCAAFVGECLLEAGLKSTGALNAKSYVKYGTKLDKPQYGCIVVFDRANGAEWQGHVGFCVGVDAAHIQVLGGNQSDRVKVSSFPLSLITDNGLRWPGDKPVATAPLKAVKAKAEKKVS